MIDAFVLCHWLDQMKNVHGQVDGANVHGQVDGANAYAEALLISSHIVDIM